MIDLLAETTDTGIVKIDLLHVVRRDQCGRAILNDELALVVEEVDCAAVARTVVDAFNEEALAQAFARTRLERNAIGDCFDAAYEYELGHV